MRASYTGGCQCGAIRYKLTSSIRDPHICHCRMCQKAAGNYFMPIGAVKIEDFHLTRGELAHFRSSSEIQRGFCAKCGTPLTFEMDGHHSINVTLGSLDDPASVPPENVYGTEARMPWLAEACAMDGRATEEEEYRSGERIREVKASNRQHPDHDTDTLPSINPMDDDQN